MKVKRFAFRIKGQINPSAILEQESIQMNTAKFSNKVIISSCVS